MAAPLGVIVLAPVGGAVQPIATMAFKIGHARQFEFPELVRLVQRILQIGITTVGVNRSVFVNACALWSDGP